MKNHISRHRLLGKAAVCLFTVFVTFIGQSAFAIESGDSPIVMSSPDQTIQVRVTNKGGDNNSSLLYDILVKGKTLIENGRLGVQLKDIGALSDSLDLLDVRQTTILESYSYPFGKNSDIKSEYNETVLSYSDSDDRTIELITRLYNDGVAFRYNFPKQYNLKFLEITDELTSFRFTDNHNYWGQHVNGYTTSYENIYTAAEIAHIVPDSLTALPLLIEAPGIAWTAVTEANLTDYAGMYLRGSSTGNNELTASLSPLPDESGVSVKARTPFVTPWRVIMIADDPGRLIESDIIINLNEPCEFDTSWIKPGKTAWDWWCCQKVIGKDFEGAMDDRTMKYFIDFSAEYGLEYMLVDAGWYVDMGRGSDNDNSTKPRYNITKSIPEIDIPGLVNYANSKGVDIIVWLHWIPAVEQMEEAFPLYEKWGVKGVKIDFMSRDDQEMVNLYRDMLIKAAEHKLLVDFHGAYKPTGIRRTYPNLITREGVMGLEWLKATDNVDPEYNCTVPFTRMLAGPMDYTPGGFDNVNRKQYKVNPESWGADVAPMVMGTRCHQLALFVIIDSPLQMVADHPGAYRENPESDFIKHVSTVWDETRVLNAKVSDYITIARKKGEEWYLGTITDWTARELTASLEFLGDGDYIAEIYADGADAGTNAKDIDSGKYLVNRNQTLTINMAPGGGQAVRIYPAPENSDLPVYDK